MPDDNRFDGIGEALGETSETDEDAAADPDDDARTADDAVDAGADTPAESEPAGPATDADAEDSAETDLTETPAFEWRADQQRALYCRQDTWEDFEDVVDFEVKRVLSDYGVRDPPKRELHDAMLRVVMNHPEEVARTLLEERGIDVDVDEARE